MWLYLKVFSVFRGRLRKLGRFLGALRLFHCERISPGSGCRGAICGQEFGTLPSLPKGCPTPELHFCSLLSAPAKSAAKAEQGHKSQELLKCNIGCQYTWLCSFIMSCLQDLWPKAILLPTCVFFSRSVITGNQPGVCLSSSKVMITKTNVEPLNCTSWWQAIQCCSCLVKSATWREGFLWGSLGGRWGQLDITMAWTAKKIEVYIYIYINTYIYEKKSRG